MLRRASQTPVSKHRAPTPIDVAGVRAKSDEGTAGSPRHGAAAERPEPPSRPAVHPDPYDQPYVETLLRMSFNCGY